MRQAVQTKSALPELGLNDFVVNDTGYYTILAHNRFVDHPDLNHAQPYFCYDVKPISPKANPETILSLVFDPTHAVARLILPKGLTEKLKDLPTAECLEGMGREFKSYGTQHHGSEYQGNPPPKTRAFLVEIVEKHESALVAAAEKGLDYSEFARAVRPQLRPLDALI